MLSGAPTRRATSRRPLRGGAPSNNKTQSVLRHGRGTSSSNNSSSKTAAISSSSSNGSSKTAIKSSSSSSSNSSTIPSSIDHTGRRALLLAAAAASSALLGSTCVPSASAASAAAPQPPSASVLDPLLEAVLSRDGDVLQPGPPPPWAQRQALLPRWLFGEWRVRATLVAFRAPLGDRFAPPGLPAAARADVGSTAEYLQRYYSTLPDTFENNARVALGLGIPQDAITPDRAFNARATAAAYSGAGAAAVAHVEYDPSAAPGRLTLEWSRLAPDFRPLPPRRAELYIQRIDTADLGPFGVGDGDDEDEEGNEGGSSLASTSSINDSSSSSAWRPPRGAPTFVWSEQCRQVSLGVRAADVADYSISTVYALLAPGRVAARQRTAIFLEPRDALYFQARRRAVAVYDYDLELERVPAPEGATACVETPKQVVQCV